ARNDDSEGWMNILFVVVLAVFWIIGGIVKAKGKKPKEHDQEQMPLKPAHKPPVRSRGPQEQLLKRPECPDDTAQSRQYIPAIQQARSKLADLREAARKFAAEAEQAFQFQTVEKKPEPEQVLPKPQVQPEIKELPEFTSKALAGLGDEQSPVPVEIEEVKHLSEILSDYASV
ncbi:MAG: hypothetical protein ACYTFW_08780, partial [Planctomycetota bacterium]